MNKKGRMHRLYFAWKNIFRRGHQASWNSYEDFYSWAITRWDEGLVLTRIDKSGVYSPDNCHFITEKEHKSNERITSNKYPTNHKFYIKWQNILVSNLENDWDSYDDFFEWCLLNFKEGKKLRRVNREMGWSSENCEFR